MNPAPLRFRLASCNVFQRELCLAVAESRNVIDVEFIELAMHERPEELKAFLQSRIDAIDGAGGVRYDAILLGYGLCGNGLTGVEARSVPLVIPRAHDCCTILLGSRSEFSRLFGESPSASWSSAGYIERGTTYFRHSELGSVSGKDLDYPTLVERYGEDNAEYLWETLHPELKEKELRYIEIPETAYLGYAEIMRAKAAGEGKEFLFIPGSMRLLRDLVAGSWNEGEFLVVPPGARIEPTYDSDRVFQAAR